MLTFLVNSKALPVQLALTSTSDHSDSCLRDLLGTRIGTDWMGPLRYKINIPVFLLGCGSCMDTESSHCY